VIKVLDDEETYRIKRGSDNRKIIKYTPTKPGKIGITFQRITLGQARVLYFHGPIEGKHSLANTFYDLNDDWGEGEIFRRCSDDCSVQYFFYLRAPITGDVTLILRADDSATLFLNKTHNVSATTTNNGMFEDYLSSISIVSLYIKTT